MIIICQEKKEEEDSKQLRFEHHIEKSKETLTA